MKKVIMFLLALAMTTALSGCDIMTESIDTDSNNAIVTSAESGSESNEEETASKRAEQERLASELERAASEQERAASEQAEKQRIASEKAALQKASSKQSTSSVNHEKTTGSIVYCTPTGKRYHRDPDCGGKNSTEIDLDKAISRGLTPCKKCAQ